MKMGWIMIRRHKGYPHTFMQDIKRGLDSNYSLCCIVWFFLRFHISFIFKLDKKIGDKYPICNSQHILCPICRLKYWFTKRQPEYTRCEHCDWTQCNKLKCNLCGRIPKWPESVHIYEISDESGTLTPTETRLGERND